MAAPENNSLENFHKIYMKMHENTSLGEKAALAWRTATVHNIINHWGNKQRDKAVRNIKKW